MVARTRSERERALLLCRTLGGGVHPWVVGARDTPKNVLKQCTGRTKFEIFSPSLPPKVIIKDWGKTPLT